MSNQPITQARESDIVLKFGILLLILFIASLAGIVYRFFPELFREIMRELLHNIHMVAGVKW